MPKFDKNRHYYNKKGQRIGTGVWVRDDGTILTPGWGEMDRATRTVTQYNTDGISPMRSWEEIRKLRIPKLSKAKQGEWENLRKKILYRQNGQERRSMAYAMAQEAKRRGYCRGECQEASV